MSAFEGADEKTILVSFKTKEAEYAVTEKPFAVPERLTRLGLSQVINHLLDREKNPIPFDFIIENEFLRTSLEVWLRRNNKTEEETITIWYMRALGELEQNSQLLHPDWVGALDKFTSSLTDHAQLPLFSGCYDGAVRLWLTAHNTTVMPDNASLELKGHTQPIKAVASFTDPNATDAASLSLGVVSGSLDRSIIMWRVQITKRALSGKHDKSAPQEGCSGVQAMRLVGHEGGVEDLDVDPTSLLMCTGSWDHTVKIWDLREEATDYNADNEEAPEDGPKKKKQKKNKNASTQIERKSIRTYTGHKGVVNAIYFSEQGSRMVTGSWDGGIRLWDVESALTLSQAKTSSPVLGMTRPAPVVASGHSDYAIRLWDSRAPDTVRSLTAHRAMPASLCWLSGSLLVNELNDGSDSALPMLASADYNGTIKVWDMRASVPLVSLSRAHNKGLPNNNTTTNNTAVKTPPHKVLSMTAFKVKDSPQYIVTGGTDNRALIHRL